jgi:hypothetical protein
MWQEPGKANWLSFGMHFVFGMFVGCAIGLFTIARRRHGIWLHEELIVPYLFGTSLICAGLGAKLGDQFWIGDRYRVIPPDAPSHNNTSLYLSITAIMSGGVFVVVSLCFHVLITYF